MEFKAQQGANGITLVTLSGRLDIGGTDQIDRSFNAIAEKDYAFVIVDLSGVDFMSTIGIGTLVRVTKSVRRKGGNLVLLAPQTVVRLVLEKTRISEFIPIADTYEAAAVIVKDSPSGLLKF
jgi:anti-sigma B factor antagonist